MNHTPASYFGPTKINTSIPCPSNLSYEEKVAQCVDPMETVCGTEFLKELKKVKKNFDPNNRFGCYNCVNE